MPDIDVTSGAAESSENDETAASVRRRYKLEAAHEPANLDEMPFDRRGCHHRDRL